MASPNTSKNQSKQLHHISFAVNDPDKVIEAWSKAFGISGWTSHDLGGIDAKGRAWKARAFHAKLGPITMEMVQPLEGRTAQGRFIEIHGPGVHHIGFQVDDLEGEVNKLVADGGKLIVKSSGFFAYVESGGPDGMVFELQQKGTSALDGSTPYQPKSST